MSSSNPQFAAAFESIPSNLSSSDASLALQKVTQVIKELSSQIASLELQRNALLKQADAYRQILSPMWTTPNDVLAEIFLRCLPDAHDPVMSIHCSPLILTRVCQRWRQLAFNTTPLWSAARIIVPERIKRPEDVKVFRFYLFKITWWLSLAGPNLPLSITIAGIEANGTTDGDSMYDVLELLLPYTSRLRSISCINLSNVSAPATVRRNEDFQAATFPILQHVGEPHRFLLSAWKNILKAPRLRSIAFMHIPEVAVIERKLIPWSQLTSLEITQPLIAQSILGILIECFQLESFSGGCFNGFAVIEQRYMLPFIEAYIQSKVSFITLPSLCELRLHGDGMSLLLQHLRMPNLSHLKLLECGETWHLNMRGLETSISACPFTLRSLDIELLDASVEHIIRLLMTQQHLESLTCTSASSASGAQQMPLALSQTPSRLNLHALAKLQLHNVSVNNYEDVYNIISRTSRTLLPSLQTIVVSIDHKNTAMWRRGDDMKLSRDQLQALDTAAVTTTINFGIKCSIIIKNYEVPPPPDTRVEMSFVASREVPLSRALDEWSGIQ